MFGRREPRLTELMRRIFNAVAHMGRIIEDWVRTKKELSNEPAGGRQRPGPTMMLFPAPQSTCYQPYFCRARYGGVSRGL